MKKAIPVVLAAAAVILGAAGCTDISAPKVTTEGSSVSAPEQATSAAEDTAAPTSGSEEENVDIGCGIWLAKRGGASPQFYYWFDGSGSGELRKQENGDEIPFTYTVSGSKLTLLYKWDDATQDITVTENGLGSMEFAWEDGRSEALTYLGGFDFDWFTFYSNDELLKMAKAYTANHTGRSGWDQQDVYIQDDDSIKIELISFDGGEPSDAAIYTIDRYTAKGTLAAGGEERVDLEDMSYETITPAAWSPEVPQRESMKADGKHIGIMYLGVPSDVGEYAPGSESFLNDMHFSGAEELFGWVTELPADRFVRTVRGREMYLIILADKDAEVTVREMLYDNDEYNEYPDDTLYRSSDGEPFVIVCNADRRRSELLITVTETDGGVYELHPWINYKTRTDMYAESISDYADILTDFTDYARVNGEDDLTARER